MQIYVGNLPAEFTDADLRSMFEAFGRVLSAAIGEKKGYGIVEMQKASEARGAIHALRGKDLQGKPLRVKVLKAEDDFYGHAQAQRAGTGSKAAPRFRGDGSYRGGGAIRRGGQRGS